MVYLTSWFFSISLSNTRHEQIVSPWILTFRQPFGVTSGRRDMNSEEHLWLMNCVQPRYHLSLFLHDNVDTPISRNWLYSGRLTGLWTSRLSQSVSFSGATNSSIENIMPRLEGDEGGERKRGSLHAVSESGLEGVQGQCRKAGGQNNHHKWFASRKIWSVEELETLPAGPKPRTSHNWSPTREELKQSKRLTIVFERLKKSHRQSDEHWDCLKGDSVETSER